MSCVSVVYFHVPMLSDKRGCRKGACRITQTKLKSHIAGVDIEAKMLRAI